MQRICICLFSSFFHFWCTHLSTFCLSTFLFCSKFSTLYFKNDFFSCSEFPEGILCELIFIYNFSNEKNLRDKFFRNCCFCLNLFHYNHVLLWACFYYTIVCFLSSRYFDGIGWLMINGKIHQGYFHTAPILVAYPGFHEDFSKWFVSTKCYRLHWKCLIEIHLWYHSHLITPEKMT